MSYIMGSNPLQLRNMDYDPLSGRAPKMPRLADENYGVVGDDIHNTEHGSILRANWIVRIAPMRLDPRQDYNMDIPRGAIVWIRRTPEKRGTQPVNDGRYRTFDGQGVYQLGATTPVLNMVLFRQARMKPDAPALVSLGGRPTPDTVYREWALGGIASSDASEAKYSTTNRTIVLDRINDMRVINVWNKQIESMQYLFMAIVAVKPRQFTTYSPISTAERPVTLSNVTEDNQEVPFVVQALPLVSDRSTPPLSCVTTEFVQPDSSKMPIRGHFIRVGICMFPVDSRFRGPGEHQPFLNNVYATETDACLDITKMKNLPDVEVKVSVV